MTQYFHFTLGPVQGFVAQARRTRDFWAGSFILSFLSAVAMRATAKQPGSKVLFPQPDKAFLDALETPPPKDSGPTQGSIPNRFMAEVAADFDPQLVTRTVAAAWRELAEVVWLHDLASVAGNDRDSPTRAIWKRQIAGFWEVYWVLTDHAADSAALDRRKNWRHPMPPDEPGAKCLVMDGWEELSEARDNPTRDRFWKAVRRRCGYTLSEGEQLCTMAFVKRRFARHFHHLKAEMPGGWILRGWHVPTAVPSVAYMAIAPWLGQVIKKLAAAPEPIDQFVAAAGSLIEAASKAPPGSRDTGYGERATELKCIRDAEEKANHDRPLLRSLDADLFFETTLENPRFLRDEKNDETTKQAIRNAKASTLAALRTLQKAAQEQEIERASPFYAVLMMDGDSLGKQMAIPARQPTISAALAHFTAEAKTIVDEHSGFLVYAGGDDVLATLPLEFALSCARALRTCYRASFAAASEPSALADGAVEVTSTLSGAIEYAHYHVPLARVLGDAHHLLDDVAKEGRGRDALAARVWTPGGRTFEWSMPWKIALESKEGEKLVLESLVEDLRDDEETGDRPFSSGFFYRIRELFALLNPRDDDHQALSPAEAIDLMTAEYLMSGVHRDRERQATGDSAAKGANGTNQSKPDPRALVERLLGQCRPVTRPVDGEAKIAKENWPASPSLDADGALLVRFLARKGVGV